MKQDKSENLSSTARQTFELVAEVRDVGRSIRQVAQKVGAAVEADAPLADVPPAILDAFRILEIEKVRLEAQLTDARSALESTEAALDETRQLAARYKDERDAAQAEVATLRAQLADALPRAERYEALLRDMSAENHEAFADFFHAHGDRILDMPRELVKDVLPEVIAVCEPADSVLYSRAGGAKEQVDSIRLESDTFGVIWATEEVQQIRNEYEAALDNALAGGEEPSTNYLYLYSVEHLKYVNFTGFKSFRFPNSAWDKICEAPAETRYALHTMEQPVGMESLWYCEWLFEQAECRFAPHVRIRGKWNTCNSRGFSTMMSQWYYNKNKYKFDELPESIDVSSCVETYKSGIYWLGGLSGMFTNVRARQYPTIDFAGVAPGGSQMMRAKPEDQDAWMPEYEQRFIAKSIGGTRPQTSYLSRQYDFQMLKNWAYDDMIATLLTYSCKREGGIRVGMQASAIAKLTQADLAAISAKNITIIKSNTFQG